MTPAPALARSRAPSLACVSSVVEALRKPRALAVSLWGGRQGEGSGALHGAAACRHVPQREAASQDLSPCCAGDFLS